MSAKEGRGPLEMENGNLLPLNYYNFEVKVLLGKDMGVGTTVLYSKKKKKMQ